MCRVCKVTSNGSGMHVRKLKNYVRSSEIAKFSQTKLSFLPNPQRRYTFTYFVSYPNIEFFFIFFSLAPGLGNGYTHQLMGKKEKGDGFWSVEREKMVKSCGG